MSRRTRRTLLIVAAVLVLLGVAVFLRSKAPPEAARLLPESDGIVYIDFKPLRAFLRKGLKPPQHVPEYQQFIDATGIDWERDLDQAAIALHRMDNPNGPNGPVAYSMVLEGRVTGRKLNAWLESHATSREDYAGKSIYSVPSEGRTVRIAQIGYDMLAISNTPTAEQIHSIVDRHRSAALPFAGSSLLERHFKDVPLLSVAWGVGQIALPFNESGAISVFGFQLPLPADATIVASVAPVLPVPGSLGALRLKVEEMAPNETEATSQAASLSAFVLMARGITAPLGDNQANNALKALLKDASVTQHHDRVTVTATLPAAFLAGLMQ
ncbi:MAG TPA: hypothetical protein VL986_14455 [Terracidiphilus sp.]|nr:hypothetical protein [Terracidiphilus sp.]